MEHLLLARLGFFYEPRGPVSYPAQLFFWEDLQNSYYLGARREGLAVGASEVWD
jgi:hypothetical protein